LAADVRPLRLDFGELLIRQARVGRDGLRDFAEDLRCELRQRDADARSYLRRDLEIGFASGGHGGIKALDAPLAVRERAIALGPRRRGQNHVGGLRGLGEEEFLHDRAGLQGFSRDKAIAHRVAEHPLA
jgi:hypothetical protein